MRTTLAACAAAACVCALANASDDIVTPPFAPAGQEAPGFERASAIVPSTGRNYTRYVSVVDPRRLSVELPDPQGCEKLVHATETAKEHGCVVATNGAFFDMKTGRRNHCIGNVVANDTVVQLPGGDGANFGLDKANGRFVIGFASAATLKAQPVTDVVQGRGWLVRDGKSWIDRSPDLNMSTKFATEKAPRTAIGVYPNGTAALVVVDGSETVKEGLGLDEFAEILAEQVGVLHAINIDGGGSSVAVLHGKVFSKPTCVDTPVPICERAMATVVCGR